MAARSPFSKLRRQIVDALTTGGRRVFARSDFDSLIRNHRVEWELAPEATAGDLLEYLLRRTQLRQHRIKLPYRPTIRYTWGDVPLFEIVQSLRPQGYFSHLTALHLHALTEQVPKTIYLNFEQQLKAGGGTLSQAGIDRAFRGRCRVSSNVTEFRGHTICVLNGANTGQLGVIDFESDAGRGLRVTSIERTLIDIAVRPVYAGGVSMVADAYDEARGRFSVNRLAAYLGQLSFTYPYHQAIGYYLDRSGKYSAGQLDLLRQFPIEFDFYLTYQMKETDYVPEWRLFIPKGF